MPHLSIVLSQLFLLLLLLLPPHHQPLAASRLASDDSTIELDDNTPSGTVLDNLGRRWNLGVRPAAWPSLKIMSPPNGPDWPIIGGLSINSSSGELYASKSLDRDDLCRQPRRNQRHPCCDTAEPCQLVLTVSRPDPDNLGIKGLAELHLRLRDVNDNEPRFVATAATLQVAEGEHPPSRLAQPGGLELTASDPDQGVNGRIDYRLESAASGPAELPFRLERDAEGGYRRMSLVTTRVLDREERDRYTMHLLAVDSGQPQRTGTLTLTVLVTDINDQTPAFQPQVYRVRLREDTPVGSRVTTVHAVDSDIGPNGVIDFSIASGHYSNLFQVTRGADGNATVSLQRKLDAESISRDPATGEAVMELYLVARDRGSPSKSSEARLLVTVDDVNDEAPEVTIVYMSSDPNRIGRGLLLENSPSVDVAQVHVRDGDSGPGGEVNCRLTDLPGVAVIDSAVNAGGFVLVSVSSAAGGAASQRVFNLRSTRAIDRERRALVEFVVVCSDSGGIPAASLTGSAAVRLRVADQNDNAPRFSLPSGGGGAFPFRLPENEPSQHRRSLGFVRATDADEAPNDKLVYKLAPAAPTALSEGAFQIDADTGELFAVRPFDREDPRLAVGSRSEAQVTLQVSVQDADPSHTDTANVVVTIEDVNDNVPRFDRSDYTFRVDENAKDYRQIGTVTAVDADESDEGSIEYRIDNGAEHEVRRHFRLDQSTGVISLLDSLDRETRGSYAFRILALDGKRSASSVRGGLRHTGTATVTIEVADVNDCEPKILQPTDGQVLELPVGTPAGHPIIEVKAVDSDLNENGRISYSIIDAAGSGLEIDKTTGTLFVIKAVTWRKQQQQQQQQQPEQQQQQQHQQQFPLTIEAADHGAPNSLRSSVRVWIRIVDSAANSGSSGLNSGVARGNGNRYGPGEDSGVGGDGQFGSQRLRATIVIGLIVFFSLLLVLAAAAALVLLRPCRRHRRDRSRQHVGGDKLDRLDEFDDPEEAAKAMRLMPPCDAAGGGLSARELAAASALHFCDPSSIEAAEQHYNLLPGLAAAHTTTEGHPFSPGKGQRASTMHKQQQQQQQKQLGSKTSASGTLPPANPKSSSSSYQMLRLQNHNQQQQQQHTYYQIAAAATMRRGEADGSLAIDSNPDQVDLTDAAVYGPNRRVQQHQQQQQHPRSRPQIAAYDPSGGASFV